MNLIQPPTPACASPSSSTTPRSLSAQPTSPGWGAAPQPLPVRMDAEQLTDNGAGHLVIASLELTRLEFQAQRADPLLADVGNLAELRQKPSDCGLVRRLRFPAPSLSEGWCGWSFL